MRKNWIALGALLVTVIALSLFVWLKPPKPQGISYAVSTLKVAEARSLRVQRKGIMLAVLEKRGSVWFMTEPLKAPADAFQVLRLLAVLEARSATQYPSFPPQALAKFELDAPQSELIINDQRVAFGAINSVTREQYVLTRDQILPVEAHFGAAVPANAAALLRRSVLAPGDTPVRFDFGSFTVATNGMKWNTTPPGGDTSQDDYNGWVAQWRDGSALRSEIADNRAPPSKPLSEISITLKDGAKVTIGILQTEPELIVRRADLGLQFVFSGDRGKQMITPPVTRK